MTAQDLIRRSLVDLGYVGPGGEIDPDELADFFNALKDLVDGLPTQRLGMHEMLRSVHALTTLKDSYTVGIGGEIDIQRPEFINDARLLYDTGDPVQNQHEHFVRVFTNQEWADVSQKQLRTSLITGIWYDFAFTTSGYGNLHVYPVPIRGHTSLVLYTPQVAVGQFADLDTTDYVWAPGAARMIRKSLAVELSPLIRQPVTPELRKAAKDAMDNFYERGLRPTELEMPSSITGGVGGASQSGFSRGPY